MGKGRGSLIFGFTSWTWQWVAGQALPQAWPQWGQYFPQRRPIISPQASRKKRLGLRYHPQKRGAGRLWWRDQRGLGLCFKSISCPSTWLNFLSFTPISYPIFFSGKSAYIHSFPPPITSPTLPICSNLEMQERWECPEDLTNYTCYSQFCGEQKIQNTTRQPFVVILPGLCSY